MASGLPAALRICVVSFTAVAVLAVTSFVAATVNGALGYGYSSISVPVALLVTIGRVLDPALVIFATALDAGLDWLPNRSIRFALDLDRTSCHGGAKTGDRPAEMSIVGRVQTVF